MYDGPGSTLTLDQAYQAAYLWMFHVGEPPSEIAERGSQAVELRSKALAAFVRVPTKPLNQRTILAVLATDTADRNRVIFSAAGFTPAAVSIAEAQGIALFALGSDGVARPQNGRASMLAPAEDAPAPFATAAVEDDHILTAANWGRTEFPDDEWLDCPGCGTNQHRSLEACRVCDTPLQGATSLGSPPDGLDYRCRECGSHDIEIVAASDPARLA